MKNTVIHLFVLALAASCSCMPAVAGEENSKSDAFQPILDRLEKMDFNAQQAWLQRLEARAARAAKIALTAEQSEQQKNQLRDLLHRKTVTWQALRDAIGATDAIERKAVDRLAESYRNNVSEAFRGWPDEARRRTEAWETIRRNWMAAGGGFERQDRLIDWLEAAIHSVDAKSIGPIPETPKIAEERQPPVETAPVKRLPAVAVPDNEENKQSPSPPAPLPKGEGRELPPSPPAVVPPSPPAPLPTGEGRELPPSPPAEIPAKPEPQQTEPAAPVEPVAPEKSTEKPFDTEPPRPAERPLPPKEADSPEKPAAPAGKMPADSVRVDADELGVRIAGCNLAFRELEAELDEKGTWDAARIEPLVDRLKILTVRRGDLDLFREMLPADKRSKMDKLEAPKTAVSQLGAKIFEARRKASSPEFKGTEAERRKELGRLETLSRRLAEATAKEKKAERP